MPVQSVIPEEAFVYEDTDSRKSVFKSCPCGEVEGYINSENKFIITRLISTDQRAYLLKKYSPGNIF